MSRERLSAQESPESSSHDFSETDNLDTLKSKFEVYQELMVQAAQKGLVREQELLETKSKSLLNRITFLESEQSTDIDAMNDAEAKDLNKKQFSN